MKPVLQMWAAAMSSRYADSATWMAWADDVIARAAQPDIWVIEMSITADPDAVGQRLMRICDERGEPTDLFNPREIHLGYRFALLKAGRITLREFCDDDWAFLEIDEAFLEHFPDVADRLHDDVSGKAEDSDPDRPLYETFRALGHEDAEFVHAIEPEFGPWSDEAVAQYQYLVTRSADDVLSAL